MKKKKIEKDKRIKNETLTEFQWNFHSFMQNLSLKIKFKEKKNKKLNLKQNNEGEKKSTITGMEGSVFNTLANQDRFPLPNFRFRQ